MPPKAKRRDPFVGLTLAGKYEVMDPLARGGMGRVYRAIQKPLGREVALKVLDLDQLEGQAAIEDFQQRFFLEAASCAQLQHPNTVVVYDYGKTEDDDVFIAMELLNGETLQDLIVRDGTVDPSRAIHIALQICGSIGGAHDQGMVHRDLKPSNVMLTARGNDPNFVKVLDFGLVKQEDNGLTQSGALLGTPRYMAPEQISNTKIGPGADIYALGAILYHMITGRPPFDSESKFVLLASHMNEAAPSIREVDPDTPASRELEQVVMRCLRKNPEERYDSMEALARALAFCPEDTDTANSSLPRASAVPVPVQAPLGVTNVARPLSSAERKLVASADTQHASVSGVVAEDTAAGEAAAAGPNLRQVLFGAIALGALLAVGLWLALRPGEDPAPDTVVATETTDPETPEAPADPSPALGAGEAAPASVDVQVLSDPPGARVEADGVDLGDSPTTIVVRSGESRRITLTLTGYETRTVEVNDRQGEVSVSLRRRRGRGMRTTVMETAPTVEMVEVPVVETPMTTPMTSMTGMTDNRDPWGR
ncbi:MAG: serine/threonine-protein kinase [Polyangiales bacterium]